MQPRAVHRIQVQFQQPQIRQGSGAAPLPGPKGSLGRSARTEPGGRGPASRVISTHADGGVVKAAEAVTCPKCSDSFIEYLLFSWYMFIVGQMGIHICRKKRGENICSAPDTTSAGTASQPAWGRDARTDPGVTAWVWVPACRSASASSFWTGCSSRNPVL